MRQKINDLLVSYLNQPIKREYNEFGTSQIPWCMEKIILEKRFPKKQKMNSKMVNGKIWHSYILPVIVEKLFPPKSIADKLFRKPKFEAEGIYEDSRGFKIHCHVDCDLPAYDMIIEMKTTSMVHEYAEGDFITNSYMLQANANAYILGRKKYMIIIIQSEFDDIDSKIVTTIENDVSKEKWDEYLERVNFIWEGIRQHIDLVAPEQVWECKYCSYMFECKYINFDINNFMELLPGSKATLTANKELKRIFDIFYDKKWIVYDRKSNTYDLSIKFEVDNK